jgi:hypothetical protein
MKTKDKFKYCMPEGLDTEEKHIEYLITIGKIKDECEYWRDIKCRDLQHHKDTITGLFAFDKDVESIFENIPSKEGCKTSVEAYLVQQIEYLKSIVFKIK